MAKRKLVTRNRVIVMFVLLAAALGVTAYDNYQIRQAYLLLEKDYNERVSRLNAVVFDRGPLSVAPRIDSQGMVNVQDYEITRFVGETKVVEVMGCAQVETGMFGGPSSTFVYRPPLVKMPRKRNQRITPDMLYRPLP